MKTILENEKMTTINYKAICSISTAAGLGLMLSACLQTSSTPDPIAQVEITVTNKSRVFLQDNATGFKSLPNEAKPAYMCKRFIRSDNADDRMKLDISMADGEAYNCYIDIESASLKVDIVETTNELFQVCLDSDYCQSPTPYSLDAAALCNPGDKVGTCPVVSVPYDEAARFCSFVGRRLPTALEHVIMRQTELPDISSNSDLDEPPAEYNDYPGTNSPPDCNTATIESCSAAPKPVTISGDNTTGSVSGDKVNGVFDLTGNVTEWTQDKVSSQQVSGADLPWFCERPIDPESPCNPQDNPADANGCAYVMGKIKGKEGVHRICIASSKLAITNGNIGLTVGGNFRESSANDPTISGIFSNALQPNPSNAFDTVGFRCVSNDSALVPVLDITQTTTTSSVPPMRADAGVLDSGLLMDAGTSTMAADSGVVNIDSGAITVDTGMQPLMDTGTGTVSDAGTSTTGASDAGITD